MATSNISAINQVTASPLSFRTRLLVPLALFALYVVWGSTYLAIRIGVASYPPFLMAACRFLIAGSILYGFLRIRGLPAPSLWQWRNAAITGSLLLVFGNGLVCYAEQTVTSGLTAVTVASMPLFAAVFAGFYGQWPRRLEWIGLLVGFVGVVLLNVNGSMSGSPVGAIALLIAAGSWAYGSVWSRRQDMPPAAMNTAAQMLTGGVVLLVASFSLGEHVPSLFPLPATLAVIYLIVMGSLIGFSAYLYVLNTVRPALATSYAYVNPPIAVLFGVLLGGERVSLYDIFAMIVILIGVALITVAANRT